MHTCLWIFESRTGWIPHNKFLHCLKAHTTCTNNQKRSCYVDNEFITYTESEVESIQDLIKEINDAIRPYQQIIKVTNDELTNEEVLIFLSLGYDDATKAQNVFSANELEFFRLLIEQIMTTESRQVTRIHAINIVGSMKSSFTKTDAEVSIQFCLAILVAFESWQSRLNAAILSHCPGASRLRLHRVLYTNTYRVMRCCPVATAKIPKRKRYLRG